MKENLEASFSVLVISIASSSLMAMGLAPHAASGKIEKDKKIARFNIDLLLMIQSKTKNNLDSDEVKLLENVINDLQLKFVQSFS